jgi:hypothetical protein
MSQPVARALASAAVSVALLLFGAAGVIFAFYLLASALGAFKDTGQAQIALSVYYKVVVLKGLLPQLLLALALHPLVRRARIRGATVATRSEAVSPGRLALLIELAVVAALAYAAVGPFLLTADVAGWPALQMKSAGQHTATFVLMTGITALAAWLPRVWMRRSGQATAPGPA